MNINLYEILNLLSVDEYQTSKELAEKIGISEKTFRNRVEELNLFLEDYGAVIRAKRRYGYILDIYNETLFLSIERGKSVENIPSSNEERQKLLLKLLLETNDYYKIDEIAEKFYISRNTISSNLKRVEEILNVYQLKLERRPNYGVRVIGKEFSKRTCLVNNLFEFYENKLLAENLMAMLVQGNIRHKVSMSEVAMENFVKTIIVSSQRIQTGFTIDEISGYKNISEATRIIMENYCDIIESIFQIKLLEIEKHFFTIHFSALLSSDSYSKYGPNFIISSKVDELVFKMLTRVFEAFAINFRNNLELRMSLNQHMVPMDIRLRYHIPIGNPLKEKIKKEYPFQYTIAATACTVLSETYDYEISDDEIAFIAIIFALATEMRGHKIHKKNIILVCVSGKSSAQLFKYKYLQAFGEYINNIFECNINELDDFNFTANDIDYIFTTVPLSKKYPIPIYEINLFIDMNEILTYRQFFESSGRDKVLSYYSTNLFIPNLEAITREEVIAKMCCHISSYGILPVGFESAVLKREELGQTDFGNYIAVPHPYKLMSEETFVAVAILNKPILWKNNEVQVVFLISVGTQEDPNLEDFYDKTSKVFFDNNAIQKLISERRFETLIEILE
ncbi:MULTISPECIES: PTS sugar transporter subunit IIA [unclassified Facklamia]|uniref:BglG family transcription antiterminator n=1 Tax=Aerococcaceae TaxID=186827 RepID=UPI0013BCB469|nr:MULTISPECIES: PTS sugar transporter subunit IIA [unclassified Facklamia]MBS4462132.1 PTS sugar transporter subunit IIA [Aerococcaceae bacterium zg-B36]NEW64592.1 PRD domain-containing protein [Facklamia sp. 252]NEW67917.1 PRD domain-containing protein [Facklamia sp. 253]QQD65405.1 PTS sugar transporter subunit IIA [Aerococcaceae bacterium zg-252]